MPTVQSSGTQVATGAEDILYQPTGNGSYVLIVDLNNMANGDIVSIKAKRKTLTGGTIRLLDSRTFRGAQTSAPKGIIVQFGPFSMPYGGQFTLQQRLGSAKNFDWSVETL